MSDLEVVRTLVRAASASLEQSRQRIDDLNVYPVPDGDTGTNLALTVRAVLAALERSQPGEREELAHEVSRAALMGARGNSGVILSQIVRGAAGVLSAADAITAAVVARALREASDAAYRAVRNPVEGTMLTLTRELAEAAADHASRDTPLAELFPILVRRGELAVERTREQLDVLRRAGVVDAGAAGVLELLRGLAAGVTGEPLPERVPALEDPLPRDAIHQELSRFRYCTAYVVEGDDLDALELERSLDPLGDSLLVVGDATALKVHVHTDDPGAALQAATRMGTVDAVEVANMHRQTLAREERLGVAVEPDLVEKACDVVAVVAGEGNRRLFESFGAGRIVAGGQTMNPATSELVAAIAETTAPDVVVLPNNPNVVLAAEQAARLSDKSVLVVPSRSIQAGLAAMVAYHPERSGEENAREMAETLEAVVTGAVTFASRDVELNGVVVPKGAYLGLVEGDAVTGGASFDAVAADVAGRLLAQPCELLTVLAGDGAPRLDGFLASVRERHPGVEVDVQAGGQPHYALLLAAE